MKHLTRLLLASWMLSAALFSVAASAASAPRAGELLPHRATYVLSLGHNLSGSDVVNVRGVMTYEFADACNGWTTTQKARLKFFYDDGRTDEVGWDLNSWEAKDGKRYRFFMRNFDGDNVTSEYKGEAEMPAPGQAGVAASRPRRRSGSPCRAGPCFRPAIASPCSAIWRGRPDVSRHRLRRLRRARGRWISAALAGSSKPAAEQAKLSPLLAAGPVYRLSLAFYAPQGEATTGDEATPQQEQSVSIYANGVIDRLTLDYGSFTVDAVLKEAGGAPGAWLLRLGLPGSGCYRAGRQARGLCGWHPRPTGAQRIHHPLDVRPGADRPGPAGPAGSASLSGASSAAPTPIRR